MVQRDVACGGTLQIGAMRCFGLLRAEDRQWASLCRFDRLASHVTDHVGEKISPSASHADAIPRRRYTPMQQKMTDRVLICLPDGRWLALSADLFREALQSGAQLAAPSTSPAQQPSSGLVTADEIGEATHMSRSTVYELAKAGVLPSVRVGRRIRFDRERVMSVLASQSAATLPQLTGRSDHGVHS